MNLKELDYEFPPELIATHPPEHRQDSRMMVVDPRVRTIEHKNFTDFPSYFKPGDVLVINDSKVFPCRLLGNKATGGKVECLLIRPMGEDRWECLLSDSRKIKSGDVLSFGNNLLAQVLSGQGETREVRFDYEGNFDKILEQIGHIPLPPYLRRSDELQDRDRYQTVYAQSVGSVAAPTAGFHLTHEMLQTLERKGVEVVPITLHVGLGTFMPVRAENLDEHVMHTERYALSDEASARLVRAKKEGRRITAVGTTATRALESAAMPGGGLKTGEQETKLFIRPPYSFQIVDRLLTNFHQPQSTLLALVGAMVGMDFLKETYAAAIAARYRLFSYGDCMFIAQKSEPIR